MASNSFGHLFRITTWGESHGKAIGVVIDGCPAGLALDIQTIQAALDLRAPGRNALTSPRTETDQAQIYAGVFEGKTTGAPISIIIPNHDAQSSHYEPTKTLLRPGHANYTYLSKYGIYDYRGSGRASARETACRVAAGAVAKALLAHYHIYTSAYLAAVGEIHAQVSEQDPQKLSAITYQSALFCPDLKAEQAMQQAITQAKSQGDSLGGIVSFIATGLPAGLGDPVYHKLEAQLASAMLSLPASKGFDIGEGFAAAMMQGSSHNDNFTLQDNHIQTKTNHAGGTLGGISTGMPLYGRVAFKPTSSIAKPQQTLDEHGQTATLSLPAGSRHDPCVAIRAVPVVDAMCALVLADALLMNRTAQLWS